ncbi:UDP-N-acetylmuramoyl-tripeptide--D-alanyl-D-alanine ligase [Candidatus Magnetaquicoccus inordinatus]|uniref:UDP-N-acetylmuramoyl-tripeptide--D-alanyl-D- alanine ligase n=1 Tax=Candidatus Magnetaquicoccus inordinatus TaxID=2496818 RepID=UPI00187D5BD5|nr:UDP-N-acetylmuramoyl-tripeptide--D-alanyl-D-alanine ligase [Candidatus Magnetaquicoccus inordinatus]
MSISLALFSEQADPVPLRGVSIDTRTIRAGELFAAVRGERFDGHDFMDKAIAAGCAAILAERPPAQKISVPLLLVDDVLHSLGAAAKRWRQQVNPLVLAVTGSCGKTTVKEMLTRVLQRHFAHVHCTRGNFNNHIGLPLTLLAMPENCQALILEMGMSAAGEITYLAQLAEPDIGIVTNVMPAHLESFHDLQGIVDAKGELLQALPANGLAIIPAGQSYSDRLRQKAAIVPTLTFGSDNSADIYCTLLSSASNTALSNSDTTPQKANNAAQSFIIHWQAEQDGVKTGLSSPGEHLRLNSLAVAAAARRAAVPLSEIALGLQEFNTTAGRGGVRTSPQGWLVIDDSYNANPGSVRAALRALPQPAAHGRRIAVLGDMLELGKEAELLHRELWQEILAAEIDLLFTAGPLMYELHQEIEKHAVNNGTQRIYSQHRHDPAEWLNQITPLLQPDDVVLVKGSRGMKMERIVENLVTNAL